MDRRSFLKSLGTAVGVALIPLPALGRAYYLMGDGKHDDTEALQAWMDGKPVYFQGKLLDHELIGAILRIPGKIVGTTGGTYRFIGCLFVSGITLYGDGEFYFSYCNFQGSYGQGSYGTRTYTAELLRAHF